MQKLMDLQVAQGPLLADSCPLHLAEIKQKAVVVA
ncbi:hypothetical protein QF012_002092 [Pseudomonas laurylsulfatiphila]